MTDRPNLSTDICEGCGAEILFDEETEVYRPAADPDAIFCTHPRDEFSLGHEPTY